MTKVRGYVTSTLLVAGAGYAAYRFLLSESAKKSLRNGIKTVIEAANRISELIDRNEGQVMEEEELPNRQRTREQWSSLGY